MDIGAQMVFNKYGCEESVTDQQVWEEELWIAEIATNARFHCLRVVEHHFHDYSFRPDNLQLMAYLTAKYPDIDVGTAAVILPWQDPLRVAEWPSGRRCWIIFPAGGCGLAWGAVWRGASSKASARQ